MLFRAEPDSRAARLRRRMTRKARMHVAAMAAKPRTTMTAIAQRGNGAPAVACCTEPVPLVGEAPAVRDAVAAEEAEARDEEAAAAEEAADADDAEEAAAAEDDDAAAAEEDATESRTAVCTAVKVAWGTASPSSATSLRVMIQ